MKTWDQFYRRILINKPINQIFDLWTTSEGLTTWFLKRADYTSAAGQSRSNTERIQVGDSYIWEWHNWDGSSTGKIVTQNNQDTVGFEFANSMVEVVLSTYEDKRTLVSLKQYQIADDDTTKMDIYCGCSCGWTFWLTNLKAYTEHGILLNESGEDLKGVFDGYQVVNT